MEKEKNGVIFWLENHGLRVISKDREGPSTLNCIIYFVVSSSFTSQYIWGSLYWHIMVANASMLHILIGSIV